jgi:hypothetical protein
MDESVEVGSVWRRKPPFKARMRVERVWEVTRNRLDEALGYGPAGEVVLTARCHPLTGGRPWVIPVADLVAGFTKEQAA